MTTTWTEAKKIEWLNDFLAAHEGDAEMQAFGIYLASHADERGIVSVPEGDELDGGEVPRVRARPGQHPGRNKRRRGKRGNRGGNRGRKGGRR